MVQNISNIRRDFPGLSQEIQGCPLVYLDNASTTQKPQVVLDAMNEVYLHANANIHRGVHTLSQKATELFENARESVAQFLDANSSEEIIFTSGCTGAINLLAATLPGTFIHASDVVLLSEMEHHSNIVPWQLAQKNIAFEIRVIPVTPSGELDLENIDRLLQGVKLVSITHASNALGTLNPVEQIIQAAKKNGALVHLDGAQAVSHVSVSVQKLDVDFYSFSGHKIFGPTGIGVLFGRKNLLDALPPYQGGGEMIRTVSFSETTFNDVPYRFEAGTPNIVGAIGLGAALDYLQNLGGISAFASAEKEVLNYAIGALSEVQGLEIIGTASARVPVVSFLYHDVHPHDVGTILDSCGVAVRTGHHCCMPLMHKLGLNGTARVSFSFYNTKSDVDSLILGLEQVKKFFYRRR